MQSNIMQKKNFVKKFFIFYKKSLTNVRLADGKIIEIFPFLSKKK